VMFKKIFLFIIILLGLFLFSGLGLDYQAEQKVVNKFRRNSHNVINSMATIIDKHKSSTALVMIHGFSSSPVVFKSLINELDKSYNFDIFAPLLPFHGRDLQQMSNFDNNDVTKYIDNYLANLAHKYNKVIVIGFSYGAAQLIDLSYKNKLANNIDMILFSPAIYLQTNTLMGNLTVQAYSLWRKYCDYNILGCALSPTPSGDDYAQKNYLQYIESINYEVMPAIKQLYKYDKQNHHKLSKLHQHFYILMARDDNRIAFENVEHECSINTSCEMFAFNNGKHYFFLGQDRRLVVDKLKILINKFLSKPGK